jgi:hypothetical protein
MPLSSLIRTSATTSVLNFIVGHNTLCCDCRLWLLDDLLPPAHRLRCWQGHAEAVCRRQIPARVSPDWVIAASWARAGVITTS